jgi:hypothetical protein
MLTANFMTTATHFFYKTRLLLLLLLRLLLPLETDRFKDSNFKGRAACIGCYSQMLCQLCKSRRCQLCKKTRPRVVSMSESDNFENALDRTIIQSSDGNKTPPTRTPLPSPLRTRRQPSPVPSPASGARPRTQKQTNKDEEDLGKLHDQPFPGKERNTNNRKSSREL